LASLKILAPQYPHRIRQLASLGLPDILDDLQKHADRFICIQINDRRRPRSWADRVLPGDGDLDLPGFFGALGSGGFKGWSDLEVF
jgi:sugar phosphate isomerase/epimerase